MPNFSDPIWGVIGVIATIVFGVFGIAGVIIAFLQLVQSKKQLLFEFITNTPILKIVKEYQDQIEIRFNQQIVKNVHLVVIRFSNSGKASIKPDEYIRPIKILVSKGQIISAEVVETDPNDLGDLIESKDSTTVVFKKTHLNSKDEFIVNLLVGEFSGKTEDIKIDARIDGIKSIKESHQNAIIEALVGSTKIESPLAAIALTTIMPTTLMFTAVEAILSSFLGKSFSGKKKKNNTFDE